MTKKERALHSINTLKQQYPNAICSLIYNKDKPYELLIATRLSAQCTDARVNIVTKDLFANYTTLDEFANANLTDVEAIVRPCGFYKVKARDTIGMCQMLISEYNRTLPDTIDELIKLPGIGRKTANLIVGDIYNKPAIVTDTHCIRICGRLGLTTSEDPKKTEDELRKLLPPDESNDFCHRLVLFGRDICKARSPKCDECPMEHCKQYKTKQNKIEKKTKGL